MSKFSAWILDNSLWFAAVGLCLASSGIDGAYMVAWMPGPLAWTGYVLNTVSDIAGMIIMYHYGRLQQTRRNEAGGKRLLQLSRGLLAVEGVTVLYSWLFSWRQLRIVLPAVEPTGWAWVAPLAAGFVPLLLAFIGYTQALLAGRFVSAQATRTVTETAQHTAAQIRIPSARSPYRVCTACGFTAYSPQAWAGHCRGAQHKRMVTEVCAVDTGGNGNRTQTAP